MPGRLLHPLILLVGLLLVVSACRAVQQLPADLGLDGAPLVTLETSGGRCVDGPCANRATLAASGELVLFDGARTTLPPERMARLTESIAATDWAAVMAKPFTGECPTAVDGLEMVWTVRTPGGPLRIADCTTDVDYEAPPFSQLAEEFLAQGG